MCVPVVQPEKGNIVSNVIDTLILELGIDSKQFETQAAQTEKRLEQVEKSLEKTEQATAKNEKQLKKHGEQQKKAAGQLEKLQKGFASVVKGAAALTSVLLTSSGLAKLAADAAKANQELDNLAKNMNTGRRELAAWQGAANMAGGSAGGMAGYMQQLSGEMNTLVMQGTDGMLPYFNELGVSMLDGAGKARAVNDVMLDLADSFAGMERSQAHSLAQQMGIDDDTFNTLVRGRAEMERLLAVQKSMYHANEQDIENSRKFNETRALLSQQWESLLMMIGNALLPVMIELSQIVTGLMRFIIANETAVTSVFYGFATAIGMVLIPLLLTATAAIWAMIAPFTPLIAAVLALGAAFALLYEDYQVWAEGGKSLFDWGKFTSYIKGSELSVQNLINAFAMLLTGYTDWASAGNGLFNWLKMKGFIDGTGISVQSLINGFRNLANDLKEFVMPYLQDFVDVFNKIKAGDFEGAWEIVKQSGARGLDFVKDMGSAAVNRAAAAVDVLTGREPESDGSLSQRVQSSGTRTNRAALSQAAPKQQDGKAFRNSNFTAEKAQIIAETAKRLGMNPNDLAAVISFETGGTFSPNKRNPKSSATGLIQFMRGKDGTYYGMTRDQFGNLSFAEQMKYVERYFKELRFSANRKAGVADVYTAVTGFGYRKGSREYELNKVWDSNKDGRIDKGEMVQNSAFRAHQRNYYGNMPLIQAQAPAGGAAVAANLNRHAPQMAAAKAPQQINNRTEVVVQNVQVHTAAHTMTGTGSDMAQGIRSRINQFNSGMV